MLTKFLKLCPKTTTIRFTTEAREPQASVQVVPEQNEPTTGYGKLMARALGSSAAILAGASLDEVVSHGGWSSKAIFDTFYRLSRNIQANFTVMPLSTHAGLLATLEP